MSAPRSWPVVTTDTLAHSEQALSRTALAGAARTAARHTVHSPSIACVYLLSCISTLGIVTLGPGRYSCRPLPYPKIRRKDRLRLRHNHKGARYHFSEIDQQ